MIKKCILKRQISKMDALFNQENSVRIEHYIMYLLKLQSIQ